MNENIKRKAKVLFKGESAGILEEINEGFKFSYDKTFLENNIPISASLPFEGTPFISKTMFPFFEGLLPEGWYLDIVSSTHKIDKRDSLGIMLKTFGDTIGAVTLEELL